MIKYLLLLLFLFTITVINGQNQFQSFINRVNSISDPTAKNAVIDSFFVYARTKGIPFITGDSANFVYRGIASSGAIAGDFNMWNPTGIMTKLDQTNFWYYSTVFEPDARLDYKIVINGNNWILDPENPKTVSGGFGSNSELSMPQYIQPWEINYKAGIQHGTVIDKFLFSTNVGSGYQLKIYFPPGYDSLSSKRYPVVYFQDGFEYVSLASAVNVIDNLIDSNKIQPLIAVFVKPNNRNEEYAGNKRVQYRNFFVSELVPFIDANYKTITSASQRLVLGDSYGGNISALISYNHPDVFGNCGLHSGAFQPNNYEIYAQVMTDLAHGITKNIKWSSIWGSYEGSLTGNMLYFKDSLLSHNYQVNWELRHEGHSWGLWRATIDNMLTYFFPYSTTGVEEEKSTMPVQFSLLQNYPNPFNPSTTISFSIPKAGFVSLKVYDILGNETATLLNEEKTAGNYTVNFNGNKLVSGVYFYKIQTGSFTATRKMILMK